MNMKTLNNGISIPQLGYGVYKVPNDVAVTSTLAALRAGYRLIDTAAFYANEVGVGEAIKQSNL